MDHVRGSAPPEVAAWFREDQADALADLARAMSHSWEAVQAGYLAWAEAEPKLAGWLATDGREGLLASGPSLTVLGRALGSDVRPLSAELWRVWE